MVIRNDFCGNFWAIAKMSICFLIRKNYSFCSATLKLIRRKFLVDLKSAFRNFLKNKSKSENLIQQKKIHFTWYYSCLLSSKVSIIWSITLTCLITVNFKMFLRLIFTDDFRVILLWAYFLLEWNSAISWSKRSPSLSWCAVMCLVRWWRSLNDSEQTGHFSFSSRFLLFGSWLWSFLWCDLMW